MTPLGEHRRLLATAAEEIRTLRRQIAALEPKARAFDMIEAAMFHTRLPQNGMAEDIAWRIDKYLIHTAPPEDPPSDGEGMAPEPGRAEADFTQL